jgi:hypothetical protein
LSTASTYTHDSDVPTLAQLISEQRRLRGFSYRELEARADSVITHQRWQQLGSGTRIKEFTEPATLRAMAKALDVDVTLVVLATAKSIGLPVETGVGQSELARMLPYSARELTIEQRDAIVSLVRAITQKKGSGHGRTSPGASESGTPTQGGQTQEGWARSDHPEIDPPGPKWERPPEDPGMSGDEDGEDRHQL